MEDEMTLFFERITLRKKIQIIYYSVKETENDYPN